MAGVELAGAAGAMAAAGAGWATGVGREGSMRRLTAGVVRDVVVEAMRREMIGERGAVEGS